MTNRFARSLYASTTSSIALGLALTVASPAFAQDAAQTPANTAEAGAATTEVPPAVETASQDVVVTGIRASLQNSARIKRNQATIVEVISAEDIGKLPDVSIADSLARLPGVTAQRLDGRDQRLSVRGLGPDFGMTLLNGREQVTVGDNRGVEYDQYPAEFFKSVVVNKSANAALVPAGISGTVDLRMLRPLDTSKPVVALNLRGQLNSNDKLNPEGKRVGYRGSATYVDQFANDTVGIAIGVSSMLQPTQIERYNAWGFPNSSSAGGNLLLGGAKPFVDSTALRRTGVVATIEVKPSDTSHTTLDILYSKFKQTQFLRGIEFPIAPDWSSGPVVNSYEATDGFVTDANVGGIVGVVRNDYNRRKAHNFSIGANHVQGLTDTINLTVDASYSMATRSDFLLENYSGTGYNLSGARDTINISQNGNGTFDIVPTLDYANPANLRLTDPRGWGYNGTEAVVQSGFLNQPKFEDELRALRASLDGELGGGFLNRWEVGAVYSRRSKDALYTSAFLCPKDPNPSCTVSSGTALSAPIPDAAIVGTVPLDYLGVPGMIALDPLYLYNNAYDVAFDNRPDSLARDYNVTEKVSTLYALVNIDTLLGSVPLRGSVGAQYVHTNQSSEGFVANQTGTLVTYAEVKDGDKYNHFLPSAALSFEVMPSTFVKMGASKTIMRPRMDQERVTRVFSTNPVNIGTSDPANQPYFTAYGGNAQLRPYKSRNLDLSLEHYFRQGGYIALSGYHKKLTDYVDPNRSFLADFSAVAATLPAAVQAQLNTTDGLVSGPANDGKGKIFGQELSLSLPFANITPALDGFGVFGSIARVKSKVQYASQPGTIQIPGLSKYVGNAEVYYEKYGFQARVSYRYRSKFIGEVAGLSASPTFRTAKAEGILDAQLGYEFKTGALEGLSIIGQAKNITNRPFVTYENNDTDRVIDYQRYGRDYYLSLSYKF
ncbi:TonB-dependent receptor [Sphingomonas sp. LY29]|uniref:TonB-dependent receptor n=1 Tax=Sphingomonas sp. LY29 TaxID=3095341 RepID=UPI002D7A2852|nr:TonB-dependent receptor [Sphingomonas sp. LY29]WRP26810.1 TonB-dependent receptor [Sphingomonas sp. LY29]